jgi:hypothetical protein
MSRISWPAVAAGDVDAVLRAAPLSRGMTWSLAVLISAIGFVIARRSRDAATRAALRACVVDALDQSIELHQVHEGQA